MAKKIKAKGLVYIILMFLVLSMFQFFYLQSRITELYPNKGIDINIETGNQIITTKVATAVTRLCINTPPTISNDCNFTIPWGYPYACQVNASDFNEGTNFTFDSSFISGENITEITETGWINFTPPQSSLGNHTIRITVYDNSGCGNGYSSEDYNLSVISANHPPYLLMDIPDRTIIQDQTIVFYLNDYFKDPDDDLLSYALTQISGNTIVNITEDSGLVTIKGIGCGTSNFYFTAFDPEGLFNVSNEITYTITCFSYVPPPSTGGGGSGGGGYSCTPDWHCGKWSPCSPNGTQVLECRDLNGCDYQNNVQQIFKNCTYVPEDESCTEDWECTEWGYCDADVQTRICRDLNSCGTNTTKPIDLQSCIMPESCINGIQDGNETGIDCGGQCKPCKQIQIPGQIKQLSIMMIITMIFGFLILIIVFYLFRRQIKKYIDKYFEKIDEHKKKPIYLDVKQKEKLLKEYNILEARSTKDRQDEFIENLIIFSEKYFESIFNMEKFTEKEYHKKTSLFKNHELRKIFDDYYVEIKSMSVNKDILQKDTNINSLKPAKSEEKLLKSNEKLIKFKMRKMLDESKYMIYLVSVFTEKDAIDSVKERKEKTATTIEQIYLKISNLLIALDFSQIIEAKKLYGLILKDYTSLSPEEQKNTYHDIIRAYEGIMYLQKYTY